MPMNKICFAAIASLVTGVIFASSSLISCNVGKQIFIPAKDFSVASGNPTLQMWNKGNAVVPVWSMSGMQKDQSVVATTEPLPTDCRGIKIQLLVVNNEDSANDSFSDVYRVDVAELVGGEKVRNTNGKPVRFRLAEKPWTSRYLTLESYVVVKGGAPLTLRVRREVNDTFDTYERPAGIVQVIVTALGALPAANVVESSPGYNSWPMMENVGKRLVCTYSRGSAHSIGEGKRDAYFRTSDDGGKTWSAEKCFANSPSEGEVMIGKGIDLDGNALFWVRCLGKRCHHDLYRTRDGMTLEKISEPVLKPFPMQITDVIHVDGKLMALWFATHYRDDEEQSWGTLVSSDNGLTWEQKTIETVTKKIDLPTEPCVVNLGGARLLCLARTEAFGDSSTSQFQLTSCDNGVTWKKSRTNIRDIHISSPSMIYEPETGLIYNYYYERGRKVVKCRVVKADYIFERPFDWPDAMAVLTGNEFRPHDAGNVNATEMNGEHFLTYYSGDDKNTKVYVARVKGEDK